MVQDATLSIDLLVSLPNCNGRIAGMSISNTLGFRQVQVLLSDGNVLGRAPGASVSLLQVVIS